MWIRLRVVPHFSSGIVERAKRERAWKSPHARKGAFCLFSVNLDLDSSDFKSSESFFKKDSPDQKSGFGFAESNAKSILRSKIRFWIHRKEHTLNGWLFDWQLIYWLTNWLANWLTSWPIDWLLIIDKPTSDWQTDWLSCWLTVWLINWLTVWLINWLVVDWPTDRMIEWLADLRWPVPIYMRVGYVFDLRFSEWKMQPISTIFCILNE